MTSGKVCRTPTKVSYKTRAAAQRALKTIKWSPDKSDKKPKAVYLCESGRHWHLTSQEH